jgi:hypothetical protein
MGMNMKLAAVGAVAALAIGGGALVMHAPSKTVPQNKGCEIVQVEQKPATGMPSEYQLTFCGVNIPNDLVTCPRNSSSVPDTGAILMCSETARGSYQPQPLPSGY